MVDTLQLFGNSERDAMANAIVDGVIDEKTKVEYKLEDLNQELDGGFGIDGLFPAVKGLSDVQNHDYDVYDPLFNFFSKVRAIRQTKD